MTVHSREPSDYNGLAQTQPTLPSADYVSAEAFKADIERIWLRDWVYVCRSEEIAKKLSFRLFRLGGQEALILRAEDGTLRAFHNTCRHRGAALKTDETGRMKSRLIVCPYHAWSYSTDGRLIRVPSHSCPADFDKGEHSLYPIAVGEWRGFVFVNFDADTTQTIADGFDGYADLLANWPLEEMRAAHTFRAEIACNWKVFWENYNECLHCPGVHPELSALVPIYGRGLMERKDDPDWQAHADSDVPEFAGTLRTGAQTWSSDGSAHGRSFADLSDAERAAGQSYQTHLPSMFLVGHVDYLRAVSLKPLAADRTELVAQWFFTPETLPASAAEMENIVSFGQLVLEQDAAICEVNQRGLSSAAHRYGVLMPEEYEVARFHSWVRGHVE